MNISQAANLIIKTSLIGEGNRLYVLNMGKPVKIYDFLIKMIDKYGEPKQKDLIIITGLQPGEKLEEELSYHNENIKPLDEDIFISDSLLCKIDVKKILEKFNQLSVARDERLLKAWLFQSISGYGD
jgi:FlaA1/EpsC-like NDP-sugar epimerase